MKSQWLIFLSVVFVIDAGLHAYLYWKLFRDPAWSSSANTWGLVAIVGLAVALPLGIFLSRTFSRQLGSAFAFFSFGWMGIAFIFFILCLIADVSKGVIAIALWVLNALGNSSIVLDPERRQFLSQASAASVGLIGTGISSVAIKQGLAEVDVVEHVVTLPKLPKALSGLTIVQLTDVHVGPTIGKSFVNSIVEKVNRTKPDLVVITGDLVDGRVHELSEHVAPFANLRSRYGTFFVTGNHEYYSGADEWVKELERLQIRTLQNQRVTIGDNNAKFELVGVDDYAGLHSTTVEQHLQRLLPESDLEREVILLAHQPKAIEDASKAKVGLQISGHTHGGQIWPFSSVVSLVQPYVAGLHRHNEQTQIYVSRGTGYWGPPMRFLAPAEITKLVLVNS